jgi:hypothetical protein
VKHEKKTSATSADVASRREGPRRPLRTAQNAATAAQINIACASHATAAMRVPQIQRFSSCTIAASGVAQYPHDARAAHTSSTNSAAAPRHEHKLHSCALRAAVVSFSESMTRS